MRPESCHATSLNYIMISIDEFLRTPPSEITSTGGIEQRFH